MTLLKCYGNFMRVFILHHTHELLDGGEDVKLIGVYSTEESGRKTIVALSSQPGFAEHAAGFELRARTETMEVVSSLARPDLARKTLS